MALTSRAGQKLASRQTDALTPARVAHALEKEGIALNEKQFSALNYYLQGESKSDACVKAGLGATSSWSLFANPKVQSAMALVLERFLVVDAAPAALRCLYSIVQDERAAPGVRVTAANSLLDRAGFDAKRLAKQGNDTRELSTMTADELRAEIARLEREQEGRMKDITADSEPNSEPDDSYLVDFA